MDQQQNFEGFIRRSSPGEWNRVTVNIFLGFCVLQNSSGQN